MISINESIQLLQSTMKTYYSLWVFYFTASSAFLGFLFSGPQHSTFITSLVATILYSLVTWGNSIAIFSTQKVMHELKGKIIAAIDEGADKEAAEMVSIDVSEVVNSFQVSELKGVKIHYCLGTLLVISGIWTPFLTKLF